MSVTATANPAFVPQSPSHWVPDEKRNSCKTCHKDFTFFNRRHHCRSCREVFCSDCSDFRLLTRDPKDPTVVVSVRACRPCFDKFRGRKIRGQKANSGMAAASPAMDRVRRNSRGAEQPPAHAPHLQQPHSKREVEMPPQHQFEGEDADITGHETIRDEEDEDTHEYEDAHPQTVTLAMPSEVTGAPVDRDAVMATQGRVVLPSKSAHGGLQFVEVDRTAGRTATTVDSTAYPAADKEAVVLDRSMGGEKDEFDRSGGGAVEGSEEILHIPADALASVKHSNVQPATAPNNSESVNTSSSTLASSQHGNVQWITVLGASGAASSLPQEHGSTDSATVAASSDSGSGASSADGIQYFRSDPCKVVGQQPGSSTSQQADTTMTDGSDEILSIPSDALASVKHANLSTDLPRSVSAVEGSEEILNIPSDALASVKHANMTSQQLQRMDDGEVAWSERNVESHIVPQTPTAAVAQLFNLASPAAAGEQQPQQQQQRPLNVVV